MNKLLGFFQRSSDSRFDKKYQALFVTMTSVSNRPRFPETKYLVGTVSGEIAIVLDPTTSEQWKFKVVVSPFFTVVLSGTSLAISIVFIQSLQRELYDLGLWLTFLSRMAPVQSLSYWLTRLPQGEARNTCKPQWIYPSHITWRRPLRTGG
jgi:hypothetical protein